MKEEIKVGFCVAYDWELLRFSLPLVYKHSDLICLSVDEAKISWAGEKFILDEKNFQQFIDAIDVDKKIKILRRNFYNPERNPMENEVSQRNQIAKFMSEGGWHIQLDCDEYFIEFESFVNHLKKLDMSYQRNTNICCNLITVFKQVDNGFLIIDTQDKGKIETIAIATTQPHYQYGRRNGYFNIYTSYQIIHQSWARSLDDISTKVKNWGHKNDFDAKPIIDFWIKLDSNNFHRAHNFHPINPPQWPSLKFISANSMEDLLRNAQIMSFTKFSSWELSLKNSRFLSKVKHAWRLLLRKRIQRAYF